MTGLTASIKFRSRSCSNLSPDVIRQNFALAAVAEQDVIVAPLGVATAAEISAAAAAAKTASVRVCIRD
jgi:hypothetical protein